MIFGGTSTRVLDSSLTTVYCIEKSQIKTTQKSLQKDLDTLGEWAVENGVKISPGKSQAIRFTRARVKSPLVYSLDDQKIPEASNWE